MRIKRGNVCRNRHKKILKLAKGFKGARSRIFKVANIAVMKALKYAYRDRRATKRNMRRLWIVRINAAVRELGLSYSKFMNMLKKADFVNADKVSAAVTYLETTSEILKSCLFHSDRKTLMTLNRSNCGATYFNDGTLIRKWAFNALPGMQKLEELAMSNGLEESVDKDTKGSLGFQGFLLYVFAVMLLL